MEGTIQCDGKILGDDGQIYEPRRHSRNGELTILLERTSWSRMLVEPIIGRRVQFTISSNGYGYDYELIEN